MDGIDAGVTATGVAMPVASKDDKSFLHGGVTLRTATVAVPEWGRTIILRELTAAENVEYQKSNIRFDGRGNPMGLQKGGADVRLLLRAVVDEAGRPVFTSEDVPLLQKQPAAIISRLFRKAGELSGFNRDEMDAVEREKND